MIACGLDLVLRDGRQARSTSDGSGADVPTKKEKLHSRPESFFRSGFSGRIEPFPSVRPSKRADEYAGLDLTFRAGPSFLRRTAGSRPATYLINPMRGIFPLERGVPGWSAGTVRKGGNLDLPSQ